MALPSDVRVFLRDLDAAAVPCAAVASESLLPPLPPWSRDYLGAPGRALQLQSDVI